MSVFTDPKIDAHCHVLDPTRFPYHPQVAYHPSGQEMGNADYFLRLMACYGVKHALLVGPNSGYATDNRCLLDALARAPGVFKGVAVVDNDCSLEALQQLQACGVVGIAFNVALMGEAFYADIEPLLKRIAQLDLWAQFQVEGNALCAFMPMLSRVGVKLLIDHCGRPMPQPQLGAMSHAAGLVDLQARGFQDLLALGREGRAVVKLSGFAKFSCMGYPFDDARPCVEVLVREFGLSHCLWASDWPYLKAPYRLDYGPMLKLYENWFSPSERQQLMWDTAVSCFGFGQSSSPFTMSP